PRRRSRPAELGATTRAVGLPRTSAGRSASADAACKRTASDLERQLVPRLLLIATPTDVLTWVGRACSPKAPESSRFAARLPPTAAGRRCTKLASGPGSPASRP